MTRRSRPGKAVRQPRAMSIKLRVDKICDNSSVTLFKNCTTGKHIKSGKIECLKLDGEKRVKYLEVELTDIMVAKVDWSGQGSEAVLHETVELEFAEFHKTYRPSRIRATAQRGCKNSNSTGRLLKRPEHNHAAPARCARRRRKSKVHKARRPIGVDFRVGRIRRLRFAPKITT